MDIKNPPIKILDYEIARDKYPEVYKWAKQSPYTLEKSIKRIIAKEGNDFKVVNAIIILESDLA